MEEIVLGGGCFWCTEAAFKEVKGVEEVISGYAGGNTKNPSYREVCNGNTGHAEVIKIKYKSGTTKLEELLEKFFKIHDPTTKDREGPDKGSQYRSIILYKRKQEEKVKEFMKEKQNSYDKQIVTEVEELENFYRAEEEHQDYFAKNPDDAYCRMHIPDKIKKIK